MKRILFLSLIFLGTLTIKAQNQVILPGDPSFEAKYENFNFKGNFAVLIDEDARNNYFLVDFSNFSSRFERVYFMNLSFSSKKIVNLDPHISKTGICFMSNKIYDKEEIILVFKELKDKTINAGISWKADEKDAWLKENDKYIEEQFK